MADIILQAVPGYYATAAFVQDGSVVIRQQGYSDMIAPTSRSAKVLAPYTLFEGLLPIYLPIYQTGNPEMVDLGNGAKGVKYPAELTQPGFEYVFNEVQPDGFLVEHHYISSRATASSDTGTSV